jgi:spore maturation protein CgeB
MPQPSAVPLFKHKRILFASEFWFGASGDGLAHGFRKLGCDVWTIDSREHIIASRSLPLRVIGRFARPLCVASYNEAILRAAEAYRPHAFMTLKGHQIQPLTLDRLRRLDIITINYYPDVHFEHKGLHTTSLARYDLFFTSKSYHVANKILAPVGGHLELLHHGYSSHVHYPRRALVTESDYTTDCLHIGIYSPYKARWLQALKRALPDVRLTILGDGWRDTIKGTELEPCYAGHPLFGDSYARTLESARINIALHSGPSGRHGWEDLVSTRTFEIPACKGFMLHIDNAEVRSLFDVGTEIDVFGTEAELAEKVRLYLGDPALREAMIEKAYKRCVPAYSYDARAVVISQEIDDLVAARQRQR